MEDKKEETYTKLQQTLCMSSKDKSVFVLKNSDKECLSN